MRATVNGGCAHCVRRESINTDKTWSAYEHRRDPHRERNRRLSREDCVAARTSSAVGHGRDEPSVARRTASFTSIRPVAGSIGLPQPSLCDSTCDVLFPRLCHEGLRTVDARSERVSSTRRQAPRGFSPASAAGQPATAPAATTVLPYV